MSIANTTFGSRPAPAPQSRLTVCGATDVGLRREQNEDTFVIADLGSGELSTPCVNTDLSVSPHGLLLLVCDGMGGAAAGEVAARLAAESIKHRLQEAGSAVLEHPCESLQSAVVAANEEILEEAHAHPEERGMGTTCTAGLVLPDRLVLAQVGDSRAYLLRGGTLRSLTRDQSLASQMLESGALRPDQLAKFPYRHVLLQALGTRATVQPVISEVALQAGDRLLLCSDGLHGVVPDAAIAGALRDTRDLSQAARALIRAALASGGPDNITVVIGETGAA